MDRNFNQERIEERKKETGRKKKEDRRKTKDRRQKTEDKRRKTADKRQKIKDLDGLKDNDRHGGGRPKALG